MSKMRLCRWIFWIVIFTSASALVAAPHWPQFRGPGARGVSDADGLPTQWSRTENVVWSVSVAGRAWSSPIVWRNQVFLTSAVSEGEVPDAKKGLYLGGDRNKPLEHRHRWLLICLDVETAQVKWERVLQEGVPQTPIHIKNTYASETPVTDGERVIAYFGHLGLFAFDMAGNKLWTRSWKSHRMRANWGTASSPVIHQDRVYIVNDNEEHSFVAALDKGTGETIWEVDRDEGSNWSTPLVWENPLRTEIVTAGTDKVRSYGLDGELLWQLEGMSSITIATPYASHGLCYVSSGFIVDRQRPIYAIRPGGRGDISVPPGETVSEYVVWKQPLAAPYNPSTLVYGDVLYVLLDRGLLSAYDAKTGKEIYVREKIAGSTSGFTASPWAYDGKVFCLSEDGDTFVIQAGREFKVLGTNRLDEMCMATPAIAGKSLLIRTLTKLYRIEEKAGGS